MVMKNIQAYNKWTPFTKIGKKRFKWNNHLFFERVFVHNKLGKIRAIKDPCQVHIFCFVLLIKMCTGNNSPKIFRLQVIKIFVFYKEPIYRVSFPEVYFYTDFLWSIVLLQKLLDLLNIHQLCFKNDYSYGIMLLPEFCYGFAVVALKQVCSAFDCPGSCSHQIVFAALLVR